MPNAVGEDVGHATLCPTYLAGYADLRESGEGGVWVMNAEWQEIRLGDVSKIRRGSSPRPIVDFLSDEGMPWVKISDATESESRFITKTKEFIREEGVEKSVIVREGDLILSNSGTAGLPKFMGITACIHDGWQVFKELNGIDKEFLYYTLLNIRRALLHNAYDNVLTNLTLDMLRDAKVRLPSLPIQREISSILLSLDEKIELNRKQNRTLEAIAQALFKRWFVEFEFPDENGQPYKSSGGAMQLSELGEIPVGWEVGTFGDEFDIVMGQSPSGDTYNETGDGIVFFQGRTDFGFRYPEIRVYCTAPKKRASKGDVLLSVRAPVGDLNVAFEDCCIGRGLAAVKSAHKSYVFYKLKYANPIFQVFETEGTVFGSISKAGFEGIDTFIPLDTLVNQFNELIEPVDSKIENLTSEIRTLSKLRDTLLPKLMSGELRVEDAA